LTSLNNNSFRGARINERICLVDIIPGSTVVKKRKGIFKMLDKNPEMLDIIYKHTVGYSRSDTDPTSMTANPVLRCAITKQYQNMSYGEMAFHLEDSDSFSIPLG